MTLTGDPKIKKGLPHVMCDINICMGSMNTIIDQSELRYHLERNLKMDKQTDKVITTGHHFPSWALTSLNFIDYINLKFFYKI